MGAALHLHLKIYHSFFGEHRIEKVAGLPETLRPSGLPATFIDMISRQRRNCACTINNNEFLDLLMTVEAPFDLFCRNRVWNSASA